MQMLRSFILCTAANTHSGEPSVLFNGDFSFTRVKFIVAEKF